ncbi:agamous-like MADS-box protein AGL65 [Punica granatum]|uniref:Agamous-like MADS-box protein AGL65 n=1 Tax=Punica granatum TaxID=22663 RepID=A0A6P8E9T2_PUNGR|nr:agamous-like MADS-box protein AGL65 [Punica granatum]XP_031406743.1 agamous-like MADS-box protein AGL65 [Punica granatum]XP_031406744.1 agamous-like MADS-box protein AGL65 [Punica granatum]
MGRVKLKIKRLESVSNRQITYSKRRHGILKKAKELSILCDIDIVLLMFSPTGKPTLFHGERSTFEEVIAKFAQLTPQERAKRKLESLEALKKTFKKLDHDVNVQDFLGASSQTAEDMTNQVRLLQGQLAEVQKRLSYWSDPEKIDNIEHLRQMEDSLRESIGQLRRHKENIGKHQLMSLERTNQYENGMQLPFVMPGMQEVQPLSWLPINENHHLMFQSDPNFLSHGAIASSSDASLPGCSAYYSGGDKQAEIGHMGQVDNLVQDGCVLNDLNGNSCLRLQVGDQYQYPHYAGLNLADDKKIKHEMEMNIRGHPVEYQVGGNVELPRPIYDDGHHNWGTGHAPCGITMYNGTSYNQQPN